MHIHFAVFRKRTFSDVSFLLHSCLIVLFLCCQVFFNPLFSQTHNNQPFDILFTYSEKERCQQIKKQFDSFDFNSEAASEEIQKLYTFSKKVNDPCLLVQYYRYHSHWHEMQLHGKDSVNNNLKNAILIAEQNALIVDAADLNFKLAIKYYETGSDYNTAFEHLFNAFSHYETLGYYNVPHFQSRLSKLAVIYMDYGEFDKALSVLLFSLNFPFVNPLEEISTYNTFGLLLYSMGQKDASIRMYKIAMDKARIYGDAFWTGLVSGNMAVVILEQGDTLSAQKLMYEDYYQSKNKKEYLSMANALVTLAEINFYQDSILAARQKMDEVSIYLKEYGSNKLYVKYYILQSAFARKNKNYENAVMYTDSVLYYKELVFQEKNREHLKASEIRVQSERFLNHIEWLEIKRKRDRFTRNVGLIWAVFSVVVLYLMLNRVRLKRRQDKKIFTIEKQKAESELRLSQESLKRYLDTIREKNRAIEHFKEETEKLKKLAGQVPSPEIQAEREKLYKSTILTEEDWINFKRLFDKVHVDFFARLKTKYPDLTIAETRLLALLRMDLSYKEIANMLGISPDSVRKTGNRLKKKLNLDAETDLSDMVNSV